MYSGSRGILYTAPPAPDDTPDDAVDSAAGADEGTPSEADVETPTDVANEAIAPSRTGDGLAADD